MREFSKLHLQSEIKEEDEEREQDGYRFGGGLRNYKEGTISPNFSNLISETKLSDVQNFGYDGRTTKSS